MPDEPGPPLEPFTYDAINARIAWLAAQNLAGNLSDFRHAEQVKACRALLASKRQEGAETELPRWEKVVDQLRAERMAREQREALDRERRGGEPLFDGDPLKRGAKA